MKTSMRSAKWLATFAASAALVVSAMTLPTSYAAKPGGGGSLNPAATLDQCQNGQVSPLTKAPCLNGSLGPGASYSDWVNGNVNGSKAHWREGEFLTYRAIVSGLANGSHTLSFQYDTVHSSKHAIDYLGSFDNDETTSLTASKFHFNHNNPCADVISPLTFTTPGQTDCTGLASPLAATAASGGGMVTTPDLAGEATCGGASAGASLPTLVPGAVRIFAPGGSTAGVTGFAYGGQNVLSGTGQCSTYATVTFSVTGTQPSSGWTVVLAWGGHIASQQDWGVGNSASSISGSPYHMALDTLDGITLGSQDRALATSAIFFTPTLTTKIYDETTKTFLDTQNPIAALGDKLHDTSTLNDGSPTAGGSVSYTYFTNGTCTGTGTAEGGGNLNNGVPPDSNSITPTAFAGSFQASYSGDSSDQPATSPCEPFTLSFTLSTQLTVSDTLAGLPPTANGSVSYTYWIDDNTCAAGKGTSAGGGGAVKAGIAPASADVTVDPGHTAYFEANYTTGTDGTPSFTTTCTAEQATAG